MEFRLFFFLLHDASNLKKIVNPLAALVLGFFVPIAMYLDGLPPLAQEFPPAIPGISVSATVARPVPYKASYEALHLSLSSPLSYRVFSHIPIRFFVNL